MKRHLTCLAVIIALAACGSEPEPEKVAAVKTEGDRAILSEPDKADFLKTAVVERDQGSTLRLPGRLVWNEDHTVRIVPQVGGRVQKITVEIGSEVKAGQILATLSSPDFGQAQADARKAQAEQKAGEAGIRTPARTPRSRYRRRQGLAANPGRSHQRPGRSGSRQPAPGRPGRRQRRFLHPAQPARRHRRRAQPESGA